MTFKFSIIFVSILLASCTTVANRSEQTNSSDTETRIGGMSRKKPDTDSVKIDAKSVNVSLLDGLKQMVLEASTDKESPLYQKAIEAVEGKLTPSELDSVVKDGDYGFLRAHAALKLGELYLLSDDVSSARKYLNTVKDLVPESDLAYRASDILEQIDAARRVQSHTVGAILPLTGRNASIGQRALRGLQMGLGLHLPGSGFKLAVMDSEGNPDAARRGVDRLVKEDNVIGIVGSLLSRTALPIANRAQELKVPAIGLSQRQGLTEVGDYVYRNSVTSHILVRNLVRTSMDNLGIKKFAILYPNDAYGTEFANIFWDEVIARGGQITAIQSYSTKETDFRLVIQRLVGNYFGEARRDEFKLRLDEMKKSAGKKSARKSNVKNVLPPIVDFEAIFIPDSIRAMGQISAMLSYSDIKKVKLLGTNLWNTNDVVRRAGHFSNDLLFVDSLTPQIKKDSRFINEYKNLYGEEPSIIEIQAYDTGVLLRQLIASGVNSRQSLAEKLNSIENVPGAIGNLSTNKYREIERTLYPLTIQKGQITPLY